MFRLGMGAYAIRRNNYTPFVHGGISASMKIVQPRWTDAHEAVFSIRLYNFYSLSGGVIEGFRQIICGSHTHPYPNNLIIHSERYSDNHYKGKNQHAIEIFLFIDNAFDILLHDDV